MGNKHIDPTDLLKDLRAKIGNHEDLIEYLTELRSDKLQRFQKSNWKNVVSASTAKGYMDALEIVIIELKKLEE